MKSKFKIFTFISTLALAIILTSCGSPTSDNSDEKTVTSTTLGDNSTVKSNIFGIKGEDIVIRKGPGEKFDKIINKKAAEALHKTQYATVDNTCKVREDDIKDGWSKIVVVNPDWLSESHQGWIETKYIIKTNGKTAETETPRKCKILNEVIHVQSKLSKVGIGELRQWHNDSYSWMSSTPYYSFGSASTENGIQNNLAYYLESRSETFIETIKIVLNINNSSEKTQALFQLHKTSKETFSSLKIKIPSGLLTAIKLGENYISDNSEFKVSLVLIRGGIDTWKLTIEAK